MAYKVRVRSDRKVIMEIQIRRAKQADSERVCLILQEAAQWLIERGETMWAEDEINAQNIEADVKAGAYFLAECGGKAAGVLRFQWEDALFWPDVRAGEAAYVHRFAVCREFAGRGVSVALLERAVQETRLAKRRFLRLDCEASRPKLRAFYENFGFRHHSDKQVGPYFVARYELDLNGFKPDGGAPLQTKKTRR